MVSILGFVLWLVGHNSTGSLWSITLQTLQNREREKERERERERGRRCDQYTSKDALQLEQCISFRQSSTNNIHDHNPTPSSLPLSPRPSMTNNLFHSFSAFYKPEDKGNPYICHSYSHPHLTSYMNTPLYMYMYMYTQRTVYLSIIHYTIILLLIQTGY